LAQAACLKEALTAHSHLRMRMFRLLALLLLRARTEECPNVQLRDDGNVSIDTSTSQGFEAMLRSPRSFPAFADIVGLDEAKAVLREAVVLPASLEAGAARLFWRSGEHSAVLLTGPPGMGKGAAAEAAAAAVGARVLRLLAAEAALGGFCRSVLAAVRAAGHPAVVVLEALEAAPDASLRIRECLRETDRGEAAQRIYFVATMGRDQSFLSPSALQPFGYVARLGLPSEAERKQYLLGLLREISRLDPQWASALREAAVVTLASLTANYTFAEIDLVVRRAFIRSTNDQGVRDPVALHHFEQILTEVLPLGAKAFSDVLPAPAAGVVAGTTGQGDARKVAADSGKRKPKDAKDPMDGIFGWCNFWLPEALHLPPVVWAMVIFGTLAHFMARSTYQPYGHRRRRGSPGARGALFGDLGGGSAQYPSFGEQLNDWYPGGSSFANFPPPPGMARASDAAGLLAGAGAGGEAAGAAAAQPPQASPVPSGEAQSRAPS